MRSVGYGNKEVGVTRKWNYREGEAMRKIGGTIS
jgi:hypothetical protein